MKRKLVAIFNILTCKNYLLVTYRNHDLLFDHTMHENDAVKYSKRLVNHYESIQAAQEIVLLEAKHILGI